MNRLFLASILILAAVLRFWDIGKLPNGLHWDEQDTGYQAYSLLKTGRDYFGNPLPLFPHSLAEYRTPVFIYSAVPFVKLLGLTPTSVRLPAAIFGTISVLLIYILANLLFENLKIKKIFGIWNLKIGNLAAFTAAFSPWAIQYSRQSVETGSALCLFLLALCLFLRRKLPISALFFGLAAAAYSPMKLFVPLFLLPLFTIYYLLFTRKQLFIFGLVFSLIFIPVAWDGIFGHSGQRFHELSIFTDPVTASVVNQRREYQMLSSGIPRVVGLSPRLIDKIIYNKPVIWAQTFLDNYFHTFSTQFLFTRGDKELRHSPGSESIGMLQLIEVFPLLIGLYLLINRLINHKLTILLWLLLAPIPASLTRWDNPHAARLFILLPALILTISLGLSKLKRPLFLNYCFLYLVSCIFYVTYFFSNYRWESAKPFQWGFDKAISEGLAASKSYDRVILDFHSDSPLMSYLFYTGISPAEFQSMQPLPSLEIAPGVTGNVFGNVFLLHSGNRVWTDIHLSGRNLVIAAADLPRLDLISENISRIDYPDSTPAFYILER